MDLRKSGVAVLMVAAGGCQVVAGLDEIKLSPAADGGVDASIDGAVDGSTSDAATNDASTSDAPTSDTSTDARADADASPGATCNDGRLNGTETDVDCGGTTCGGCANTKSCVVAGDCASGACGTGMKCGPTGRASGATGNDAILAIDVAPNGDIVAAGYISGTTSIDFGGMSAMSVGANDVVVARYSRVGVLQWVKAFGSNQDDEAHAVAFDKNGDVIVAGRAAANGSAISFGCTSHQATTIADAFVVKLDGTNGLCKWSRLYNAPDAQDATALVTDSSANVIVGGNTAGAIDFGSGTPIAYAGSKDVFVAKLDGTTGNPLWSFGFGGTGNDQLGGIAVDLTGRIILGGLFSSTVKFGTLPSRTAVGQWDAFMLALDPTNGAPIWDQGHGGAGYDATGIPIVDKVSGALYFAGTHTEALDVGGGLMPQLVPGNYEVFVTKRNPTNGNYVWGSSFGVTSTMPGGTEGMYGEALALDPAGNPVLGGRFWGAFSFGGTSLPNVNTLSDFYLVKFDKASGSQLTAKAYGGAGDDGLGTGCLKIDARGNFVIAGYFQQAITLDGVLLTSHGAYDAFLASLGAALP